MTKIGSISTVGELIRGTRKSQGLTQKQLTMVSGVGLRFLRELESGKQSCHIGKVYSVLRSLGIDLYAVSRSKDQI